MRFTAKRIVVVASILLALAGISIIGVPVYGFKAHQGKLPLAPFGWSSLPEEVPYVALVNDQAYAGAAERAREALLNHREQIAAPALSAAVAIRGELIWAGAAGWSNIKLKEPAAVTTRFRLGSTSKAITATLLARLVEQGFVSLDAPISTYWQSLPNSAWRSMTLRHLVSHQSGLPHYKENTDLGGLYASIALNQHYSDVRDAISVFDGSDLLFPPGEGFHYSTLGTVLLAAVLSQAVGSSYRTLIADHVATPLQLSSLTVAPSTAQQASDVATSYYVDGQRFRQWRPVDLTHRLPGGGWAAAPSDLVRLGMAWLDDGFLLPATRSAFWTPQLMSNDEVNAQNYALGFRWSQWESANGTVYAHANHGGVSRGAQSWLMILPEQQMSIAFSINRNTDEFGEFGRVYRALFDAFMIPLSIDTKH